MAGKRKKPEDIVQKLRQVDVLQWQGKSVQEAVRQIGVAVQTYYLRWGSEHRIEWRYIALGAPMHNGFVESFDGWMRDELLNETMFRNLVHARIVITAWAADDNTQRPHSALDYQSRADYALMLTTAIAGLGSRGIKAPRLATAQPAPSCVNTNRAPVATG